MRKKYLCINLILLFCLLLTSCKKVPLPYITVYPYFSSNSNQNLEYMDLDIIEFNDIHGSIDGTSSASSIDKVSAKIEEIRNKDNYDNTILIANGDMFQGTALSRVSYGKILVDIMNQMKFDCMGIGNHEFDWYLDEILNFFDGDISNGEADFPLLNANIYYENTNNLVGYDKTTIMPSTILEREGIKIGIISYIGQLESSINANMLSGYYFNSDYNSFLYNDALSLKNDGCDIIIVNIHGGNSESINNYNLNNLLANLKYNNEYLVDAVINGHTHTKQKGVIKRDGGVDLPVIQSAGNLECFGKITLRYSYDKKDVISYSFNHFETSSLKDSDTNVLEIINSYKQKDNNILNEVYTTCTYNISRYDQNLQKYIGNVGYTYTNCDVFITNVAGIRNGLSKGNIDFNQIYSFLPFDNVIIIFSLEGKYLKEFYNNNLSYYLYGMQYSLDELEDDTIYKVSCIDYVFFSSYFSKYKPKDYEETNLILRDLVIEDLKLHTNGFNPSNDNSSHYNNK